MAYIWYTEYCSTSTLLTSFNAMIDCNDTIGCLTCGVSDHCLNGTSTQRCYFSRTLSRCTHRDGYVPSSRMHHRSLRTPFLEYDARNVGFLFDISRGFQYRSVYRKLLRYAVIADGSPPFSLCGSRFRHWLNVSPSSGARPRSRTTICWTSCTNGKNLFSVT